MLIQEAWVLGKVVMDGAQREGSQGLRVIEEKRKRGLRTDEFNIHLNCV